MQYNASFMHCRSVINSEACKATQHISDHLCLLTPFSEHMQVFLQGNHFIEPLESSLRILKTSLSPKKQRICVPFLKCDVAPLIVTGSCE